MAWAVPRPLEGRCVGWAGNQPNGVGSLWPGGACTPAVPAPQRHLHPSGACTPAAPAPQSSLSYSANVVGAVACLGLQVCSLADCTEPWVFGRLVPRQREAWGPEGLHHGSLCSA